MCWIWINICCCARHMLTHLSFSFVKVSFSPWRNVCKSHRRETAEQHCSRDSERPLEDTPVNTLQDILHFFCLFATICLQRYIERCIIWAHVRYLYILNAPGSSAKQAMSPDSRAFSAKSSRSSSSFCCCHGSMPSQVLGAASPTKIVFSHEAVFCGILWWKISPSSLTVVLLQHFFVQQLGHDIIFHIHQEKDIWETDRAPGLTPNPWNLTLRYYTVHTLWCQPKKINRSPCFTLRIYLVTICYM